MSPFPYCRIAQSLVCSHMDDMVGTLVVPFIQVPLGKTSLDCRLKVWLMLYGITPFMNFLAFYVSWTQFWSSCICVILPKSKIHYMFTLMHYCYVLLCILFFMRIMNKCLSIKPMVIILKLLLIPLPFMLLPLIRILTIWVFLFMISANALKFMKLRVDLISVELCCILVDHW